MSKGNISFFVVVILILASANRADAYLDLGTGSYIAQALIAAVVTVLFFLKSYWRKLKSCVNGVSKKDNDED